MERLLLRAHEVAYRFSLLVCRHPEDAEDVMQDALPQTYRHVRGISDPDGDIDAAACKVIERHCQTCARCATLVTGLRETVGLCRQAASVPLPDSVRQRARESVQRLLDTEDVG